jgi:hypothetical protein
VSNAIMNACRPVQMPPTSKNVLMAVADRAHDDGVAWPSIPGLCEATCYGRTAVIDAVRWLERAGFVSIEKSAGRNNRFKIDLERVGSAKFAGPTRPPAVPVREADPSAKRTPPVREADPHPSASRTAPVRQADPNHKKPPSKHQTTPTRADDIDRRFAEFWAAYPRRVGKEAARKAFDKRRPGEELLATMLAAIARQVRSPEWIKDAGQYIPHASSWLNGARWEDEAASHTPDNDRPEWATRAGFSNRYEAENAGCAERNAASFSNGRRIGVPA